jgi:hypothetical protein
VKHAIDTGPARKKATPKLGGNGDAKSEKVDGSKVTTSGQPINSSTAWRLNSSLYLF